MCIPCSYLGWTLWFVESRPGPGAFWTGNLLPQTHSRSTAGPASLPHTPWWSTLLDHFDCGTQANMFPQTGWTEETWKMKIKSVRKRIKTYEINQSVKTMWCYWGGHKKIHKVDVDHRSDPVNRLICRISHGLRHRHERDARVHLTQ